MMYQNTPFDVYFLGVIHEVNLGGGDNIRDPDVQLIDKVEEAQVGYTINAYNANVISVLMMTLVESRYSANPAQLEASP